MSRDPGRAIGSSAANLTGWEQRTVAERLPARFADFDPTMPTAQNPRQFMYRNRHVPVKLHTMKLGRAGRSLRRAALLVRRVRRGDPQAAAH